MLPEKKKNDLFGLELSDYLMFMHFSQFATYVIPIAGLIAPIIMWIMAKDDHPEVDAHGKMILNWIISSFIYAMVSGLLCFILIGIPLLTIIGILIIIFPIIGGIKAKEGTVWKYPMTIKFL